MPLGTKIILLTFIFNSFITAYAYQKELSYLIVFCSMLSFVTLGLYHIKSVKKTSALFLCTLFIIFLSEIFFNLKNYEEIIAYVLAFIYRGILLFLIVKSSSKVDKKQLSIIITCFTIITVVVLSFTYNNSALFLMAILNAVLLVLLSSILFISLFKTLSGGNIELFLSIFLIFIADATFVLPKFNWDYKSIFYCLVFQGAYYLLCAGITKRQNKTLAM